MKSTRWLLLIIILLLIILLIAAILGGFATYKTNINPTFKSNPIKVNNNPPIKETSKLTGEDYYKASIDDVVLNITTKNGEDKLMKISLELISYDPKVQKIVNSKIEEITDMIIMTVNGRSEEELRTLTGRDLLIDDIINNINKEVKKSNHLIKNAAFKSLEIS